MDFVDYHIILAYTNCNVHILKINPKLFSFFASFLLLKANLCGANKCEFSTGVGEGVGSPLQVEQNNQSL